MAIDPGHPRIAPHKLEADDLLHVWDILGTGPHSSQGEISDAADAIIVATAPDQRDEIEVAAEIALMYALNRIAFRPDAVQVAETIWTTDHSSYAETDTTNTGTNRFSMRNLFDYANYENTRRIATAIRYTGAAVGVLTGIAAGALIPVVSGAAMLILGLTGGFVGYHGTEPLLERLDNRTRTTDQNIPLQLGKIVLGAGACFLASDLVTSLLPIATSTQLATEWLATVIGAGLVAHKGLVDAGIHVRDQYASPAWDKAKALALQYPKGTLIALGALAAVTALAAITHGLHHAVVPFDKVVDAHSDVVNQLGLATDRHGVLTPEAKDLVTNVKTSSPYLTTLEMVATVAGVGLLARGAWNRYFSMSPRATADRQARRTERQARLAARGAPSNPEQQAAAAQKQLKKANGGFPHRLLLTAAGVSGALLVKDPTGLFHEPTSAQMIQDLINITLGTVGGLLLGEMSYKAFFKGTITKRLVLAAVAVAGLATAQSYAQPDYTPSNLAAHYGKNIRDNGVSAVTSTVDYLQSDGIPMAEGTIKKTLSTLENKGAHTAATGPACQIDVLDTDAAGNRINADGDQRPVRDLSNPRDRGANGQGVSWQKMTDKNGKALWVRTGDWQRASNDPTCG